MDSSLTCTYMAFAQLNTYPVTVNQLTRLVLLDLSNNLMQVLFKKEKKTPLFVICCLSRFFIILLYVHCIL